MACHVEKREDHQVHQPIPMFKEVLEILLEDANRDV